MLSKMHLVMRDAVLSDMPRLRTIFRSAALTNEGDRPNLLAHPEVLEYGDEWVRAGQTRAACVAGRIVGFATGLPQAEWVELEDLFVDPDWMRRGVASALVRDVVRRAAASGVGCIEVTANEHAMAFYESVGFVRTSTADTRFGAAARMRLAVGADTQA